MHRDLLFNSCHLAYLFNYHLARGGQLPYSSDRCRLLYRLKHIRTADSWLRGIFADAVRHTFNCGQNYATCNAAKEVLQRHALELFRRNWHECMLDEWRKDPKSTNIFEIYYDQDNVSKTLFAEWLAVLEDWLKSFTANSLFDKLWQLDSLKWRPLDTPASFDIDGIRVWINPLLAWRDHDYGAIMIFSHSQCGDLSQIEVSLASMLLSQKTYLDIEKQEIMLYMPGNDDIFVRHPVRQELKQCKMMIRESSGNMREFEHNIVRGMAVSGQRTTACESCRFIELCRGNDFFHNGLQ
ncbi:MAG: hypothetical protein L3J71_05770 [Victivallaceae bacterium]|nr:hypothetical protein [Victivallaceae bacterium]